MEHKSEICRYCGDKECDRTCTEVDKDTMLGIMLVAVAIAGLVVFIALR